MSKRMLGIAVAIAAVGVGVLVLLVSRNARPNARRTGAANPPVTAAPPRGAATNKAIDPPVGDVGRAPGTTASRPAPPRLPVMDPVKPASLEGGSMGTPSWERFDQEASGAQSVEHERVIRERLTPLLEAANHGNPGAVAARDIECRATVCRLHLVGSDETAFRSVLESTQDERGFHGYFKGMALDSYAAAADKETGEPRWQVRVHLDLE